jgi:branched-chain amino acid transport system substrate-binding protein
VAAVVVVTGCGGSSPVSTNDAVGETLAVYSSLPLQGPWAAVSEQIVGGEKLALAQAGGRAGRFRVAYVSLDDSNPASGQWSPGVAATDAKTAAQDTSTIAYLGDYDSGATAISLPLINGAGILQISPGSPYVGLTQALDAGQDEPGRFYPTGRRTFVRLPPGDPVQALAQVQLMRDLGIHRVYVIDDQDQFDVALATLVAGEAQRAGVAVVAHDSLPVTAGGAYTGEAEKVIESGAQAVFFSGATGEGAITLWRQLREADPHLTLLGSSSLANEAFVSQLGSAGEDAYIASPALPARFYPPAGRRILSAYEKQFGAPAEAYVLFGYEAMSMVLDAIRKAGGRGNNRQTVINELFAMQHRRGVLGPVSIEAAGETTLARYAADRVSGGALSFFRKLEVHRQPAPVPGPNG